MLDQIIEKYLLLRERKALHKAEYEAKVAEIDKALDKLENHLLKKMQEAGLKSLPTESGTAYIQHRTSASVADWEGFLSFVRQHDAWNMLEKRASKSALEEYKLENDDLPPGVNWNESIVVNVRRS